MTNLEKFGVKELDNATAKEISGGWAFFLGAIIGTALYLLFDKR